MAPPKQKLKLGAFQGIVRISGHYEPYFHSEHITISTVYANLRF